MYYSNGNQRTPPVMQFQSNPQQYAVMLPRNGKQRRQPFIDPQQRQAFPPHVAHNPPAMPLRVAQLSQGAVDGPMCYPQLDGGYQNMSSYVPQRHQTEPVPSEDERYRKQLIVNYLAPDVSSAELHNIFSRIGPLDGARIIYDRQTCLPKGYGFVYFCNPEDAKHAVDTMNGFEFHGKRLKVGYSTNPLNIVSSVSKQDTNATVV